MLRKKIGIFTYKVPGVDPWDPSSISSGITGSEEAVIYISEELALLGYDILVFGDPPLHSKHRSRLSNPRYVDMRFAEKVDLDIAISWRHFGIGEELKKIAKRIYLWPHDTCAHVIQEPWINAFDDVLWLSRWQQEQWAAVNPGFKRFNKIFGNGIPLTQFPPIAKRSNPYSCIYGSNYARGLELLLEIWPEIKTLFPRATLEIYYGWQTYGLLSKEKQAKMQKDIRRLSSLGVSERGQVGHDALNAAYAQASLWTYPCLQPEVFCITALRAQYSGTIPVVLQWAALAETVRHGFVCHRTQDYFELLIKALSAIEKIPLTDREQMRTFIAQEYSWKTIAKKWDVLFAKEV